MIFAIAALMCLGGLSIVASAAHVEIGTGTSTQSYIPFYGFYDYGWSETIYLQAEIGGAIGINGLSYYVGGGVYPYTIYNQKVYMTHTTLTAFADGNKPDPNTMTLVYDGDWTVTGLGWNKLNLETSFNYNGVDNLLIYWENWDGDYQSGPTWRYTTTSPSYRAVYRYADNAFPTTAGTRTYSRPNIRLHYPGLHDVAVTKIISPELKEGYGSIPVTVEVKNTGLNTETFPVNVVIRDQSAPKTVLYTQDFTGVASGAIPVGWSRTDTHWGAYASTLPGGVSPCMRFYYSPSGTSTWRVWTQTIDTSLFTELEVLFKQYLSQSTFTSTYYLKLQTSTDGINWNDAWSIAPTASIPAQTITVPLTAANGVGSATLRLAWTFVGYTYQINYWMFDDVILRTRAPKVYDQTITISNLNAGETTLATSFPNWNVATSGLYEVTAQTQLGTDVYTADDKMVQTTQVGLVNASLVSIDVPHSYMGPAPFNPKATVKNGGQLDFLTSSVGQLPVHATILDPSGGTGLCFEEQFEGTTGFYEFEGETDIVYDNGEMLWKSGDYVGGPGMIRWPDDTPEFGAPGDWTILNSDDTGTTWHPTTYRSSPASPVQSMYHGNEITKLYDANSWDMMISPQMYVGPNGGSFGFDLYNDVEPGWDYLVFGASPDGISFSWWWFGPSSWNYWMSASGVPIFPTDVDANGYCYLAFGFTSDSSFNYEGCYVDNVKVYGSPYLYDETVYVNLLAGANLQVEFPTFTPLEAYHDYTIDVCCEHPKDSVPADDCGSLAFNNNAPVYNTRTGYGYTTIQAAIDSADTINGDTLVANDGNFYEDINIWKDLTVMGKNPPEGGTTYLYGTVDITADGVTFENFYVMPLTLFTSDEAGIAIYSNDVIVRHNIVEIQGQTSGTIKGIHAYASPSDFKKNIEISNNTVRNVKNAPVPGTLFTQDFTGIATGAIPVGWTRTDTHWGAIASAYAGGVSPEMRFYYSPVATGIYRLATPAINTVGFTNLNLDFKHMVNHYATPYTLRVQTSTNGITWSDVWSVSPTASIPATPVNIPLTTANGVGSSTLYIAWVFDGYTNNINYWYVDNIVLAGPDQYGGAVGIMDQGATWNVDILNNDVYDIHSAGWSHGIEITPTAEDPVETYFEDSLYFAEYFTGLATGTIPTGWTRTATNWGVTATANAGGASPEMRLYWSPSVNNPTLITPEIDTTDFTTLSFSFRQYMDYFTAGMPFQVYSIANGVEHLIYEWKLNANYGPILESFTLTTAAHGVGASDFQLAWRFVGSSFDMDYWYIDNVVLSGSYSYWMTVQPWPIDVNVEGNYLSRISKGPGYTYPAPPVYDGIMLTIDYAWLPSYGPTPADASEVIAYHNWFDMDCYYPSLAILNMDLQHCLMATDNYYSYPNGPGSFDPYGTDMVYDCLTGEVADGSGSQIVLYGPVAFDPWLGLNAEHNIVSPYYAEVGELVMFDGSASWTNDFNGVDEPLHYFWKFDDGYYSMQKTATHIYNSPGVYKGYLRVQNFGLPEFGVGGMFAWNYFTIIVTSPGSPLTANAGGGSLGSYEVSNGEQLTLSGIASGGTQPYTYQWNLGDGRTVESQNPTVAYKLPGDDPVTTTYTVTLTVIDGNYDTATDTATVTVLAPGELYVSINAPINTATGYRVFFNSEVAGGEAPYSYLWSFDDGITSTEAKPYHIYENAGVYTVTFTVTDNLGMERTATHTITAESAATSDAEIKSVKGGLSVKATIAAGDNDCDWTINVDGKYVILGGEASGTIQSNTEKTVKLPLTFAFGKVDITVTANEIQKQYTAFALGPLFLSVKEA